MKLIKCFSGFRGPETIGAGGSTNYFFVDHKNLCGRLMVTFERQIAAKTVYAAVSIMINSGAVSIKFRSDNENF